MALQNWMRRGGYAPSAAIVRRLNITQRRALVPGPRCRLFLERYETGWALVWTGSEAQPIVQYWPLRKET